MAKRKKYLWQHPRTGHWYFRRFGKYTRIVAAPGTPSFDAEYWTIYAGPPDETSVSDVLDSYRRSNLYLTKAPKTRKQYDAVLEFMHQKAGTAPIGNITRKEIMKAMAAQAKLGRVRFANSIPQVMRMVMKHAVNDEILATNPLVDIPSIPMPAARKKEHVVWTDAAVAKWRANAQPLPRLIFELGLGSVQRPDDWTRIKWADYDGHSIELIQQKTGAELIIPASPELRDILDQTPRTADTIISRAGQSLNYDQMSKVMLKERKRLGTAEYDLHALRYRGVQELAWAGCTDDEIASYSGHDTLAMVRKYAGKARQVMRARQAASKRATKFSAPVESESSGEIDTKSDTSPKRNRAETDKSP